MSEAGLSEAGDGPFGRPAEGEQQLDQRGLAGPVRPEQAEHLARRDSRG